MPDHWHALIGVDPPLTVSRAVQDIKWIAARRIVLAAPVLEPLRAERQEIRSWAFAPRVCAFVC
jgi:REP element-mobilizing transposase RayT